MPFEQSANPVADYNIRIFFAGLLMLSPRPEAAFKRCDVFVVDHHAPDHELSVDVSIDAPQPTFPFLRLGTKILNRQLRISTGAPHGVRKFTGTPEPGVDPISKDLDFKFLHRQAKLKPEEQHRAVIKITDGLLHTAVRSERKAWRERNGSCTPCTAGLVLGIRLKATGEQPLKLTWHDGVLILPRAGDLKDTRYVILVNNSRPVPSNQNDFKHLYHALTGVSEPDQYNLHFDVCPPPPLPPKPNPVESTPRIPCIPGVTDG